MRLNPPFEISPRLLPALRIDCVDGPAWIQLEYASRLGDNGRTRYRWTIDIPGIDGPYDTRDLDSELDDLEGRIEDYDGALSSTTVPGATV